GGLTPCRSPTDIPLADTLALLPYNPLRVRPSRPEAPPMRALLAALPLLLPAQAPDKPLVLDLWPDAPPGEIAATGAEKDLTGPKDRPVAGKQVIRLGNVSRPTITVYRPAREKNVGTTVIVCPGGGYHILAWDLEG